MEWEPGSCSRRGQLLLIVSVFVALVAACSWGVVEDRHLNHAVAEALEEAVRGCTVEDPTLWENLEKDPIYNTAPSGTNLQFSHKPCADDSAAGPSLGRHWSLPEGFDSRKLAPYYDQLARSHGWQPTRQSPWCAERDVAGHRVQVVLWEPKDSVSPEYAVSIMLGSCS